MTRRIVSMSILFCALGGVTGVPVAPTPAAAAPVLDSDTGARYHAAQARGQVRKAARAVFNFDIRAAAQHLQNASMHLTTASQLATSDATRAIIADAAAELDAAFDAFNKLLDALREAARRLKEIVGC